MSRTVWLGLTSSGRHTEGGPGLSSSPLEIDCLTGRWEDVDEESPGDFQEGPVAKLLLPALQTPGPGRLCEGRYAACCWSFPCEGRGVEPSPMGFSCGSLGSPQLVSVS